MALPCRTTGSLYPSFDPDRHVRPTVKHAFAIALRVRLPSVLSIPLKASVTLLEATTPVKLPTCHGPRQRYVCRGEHAARRRVVFHRWLPLSWRPGLNASHLCYTASCSEQWQAAVKVHGVFLSCRGYSESSPRLQFRRARGRDSAQVVTPFVQVGTYPTRNFATLGPL